MKIFSKLGRTFTLIAGWALAILFGLTFVVSLFDDVADEAGMLIVCFVFAAAGVWMIVSSKRARKAELEKEKQDAIKAAAAKAPKPKIRSFIAVECPNCGATAGVEKNGIGRCEYCGGVIDGRT